LSPSIFMTPVPIAEDGSHFELLRLCIEDTVDL
jgi:hypothetical protein